MSYTDFIFSIRARLKFAINLLVSLALLKLASLAQAGNEPFCYSQANLSFDKISAQRINDKNTKILTGAIAAGSYVMIAPTFGASIPMGMMAGGANYSSKYIHKQAYLGALERFMETILEAHHFHEQTLSKKIIDEKNYPYLTGLRKRVSGFFGPKLSLAEVANLINSANHDQEFCQDLRNLRIIHLKDYILENQKIDA